MNRDGINRNRGSLLSQWPQAQEYLDTYDTHIANARASAFMVIKVGGGIIEDEDLMRGCVEVLGRLVGLGYYPVVVHGGGPQISAALEDLDEEMTFRDGLRVTSERAIGRVVDALARVNHAFVQLLETHAVPAVGLSDVFVADHLDKARYGEVGHVVKVEQAGIEAAVLQGRIPVVSCIAHSTEGSPLNANGDDAAAELVTALRPHEYVSFTPTGGVNGTDGGLIRHLSPALVQRLHDHGQLDGGMYKKAVEALRLVQSGVVTSILIVRPEHLIEELFSDNGYGTIVSA